MKLKINLGLEEELKYAKITYTKTIPVKRDSEVIWEAVVNGDGTADVYITNEEQVSNIKRMFEFGIGEIITSRTENLITGIDLKEVSII